MTAAHIFAILRGGTPKWRNSFVTSRASRTASRAPLVLDLPMQANLQEATKQADITRTQGRWANPDGTFPPVRASKERKSREVTSGASAADVPIGRARILLTSIAI